MTEIYKIKNLSLRKYQEEILETCKEKSTLVCLPTGTGKTLVALSLAIHRLDKIKGSKIAIVSPTRPLNAQHLKTFENNTTINQDEIVLLTGKINPEKRKELYNKKVIVATTQKLEKDLLNNRFSFKNFSALILDEAHRAIGNYAYTFLTEKYLAQSECPIILALTASPGGTKEKIKEIKENLKIEAVEIRTEDDIKEFIQEKNINCIYVDLPKPFKQIHEQIKKVYKTKLKTLRKFGITKPTYLINKRDLLGMQKQFQQRIKSRDLLAFAGISLTSLLI